MEKKPYQKPTMQEVKLSIDDTLLSACRKTATSRVNPKRGTSCRACRTTYRSS
ncbi:MAG: hypothetical protein N2606_04735 [Candidatus Omnitrophica bacterium]|nr:hypothetical protein [Candidatus Omnitrophota bacterium]